LSDLRARPADKKESLSRRIGRNFGRLLRGRGVAAVLEVLTVALLARSLTPADFGQVVLIQTYVQMIKGLFNFRLFESVVRYGLPAFEAKRDLPFRRLLGLTLSIDIATSAVSFVVAIVAVPLAVRLFEWDDSLVSAAMIFSITLLASGIGTPKGLLRMFDRFDVLGVQLMISPVLRLLGVIAVSLTTADIKWFIVVLAIGTMVGNIYLIARGWMEFGRRVGGSVFSGPSLKGWRDDFPSLRGFLAVVYAQSNLDNLPKNVSTMLAGTLLSPAAAGMLRIARESTKILSKPGALLQQVLFPNLVRLWHQRTPNFRFILVRAILVSGLFGLVFVFASVFGGGLILTRALGPDYAAAAPLMSLMLLSATIELVVFMLRTGGYAMGLAARILWLHLISAVLYLTAFVTLTPSLGLIGPGLAACFSATVTLAGIALLVNKGIQRAKADNK